SELRLLTLSFSRMTFRDCDLRGGILKSRPPFLPVNRDAQKSCELPLNDFAVAQEFCAQILGRVQRQPDGSVGALGDVAFRVWPAHVGAHPAGTHGIHRDRAAQFGRDNAGDSASISTCHYDDWTVGVRTYSMATSAHDKWRPSASLPTSPSSSSAKLCGADVQSSKAFPRS